VAVFEREGERLGVLDLLGDLLGVADLERVWEGDLEAVLVPEREGEEPLLTERVGVLLSDEETEAVGERVAEGVADLLAV
jgi:hypothetical protein